MLVMLRAAVPLLVRVTVCAWLLAPTVCEGKVRVVGERVIPGAAAAAVAVPVNATSCGLPAALSAIDSEAVLLPVDVGLKTTLMAHEAPTATLEPQVLVSLKSPASVPVTLIPVIASEAVPLLVRVTACDGLLVPTACDANVRLAGETPTVGVLAAKVMLATKPLNVPLHAD